MTGNLSTYPAFHFLTDIKLSSAYRLLTGLFMLFTLIASMTPAQAELIDLSNPEPVIQLSTQDAGWLIPPRFDRVARFMDRYLISCSYDEDGNIIKPCDRKSLKTIFLLRVDKQGRIKNIKVIKSSGIERLDKTAIRELYKARFKPFLIKGQAVEGNVTLPIEFK